MEAAGIAVLVVGGVLMLALVAALLLGPFLAMRNPAEADRPTHGAGQVPDRQEPSAGDEAAQPLPNQPTKRGREAGPRRPPEGA